jgi:hypothetical protein
MSRQFLVFSFLLSMSTCSQGYAQGVVGVPPYEIPGVSILTSQGFKTNPIGSSSAPLPGTPVKYPQALPLSADQGVFENQEREIPPFGTPEGPQVSSNDDRPQNRQSDELIRVVRRQSDLDTLINSCLIVFASIVLSILLVGFGQRCNEYFTTNQMSSSRWVDVVALVINLAGPAIFLAVLMLTELPVSEPNIQLRGWSATAVLLVTLYASITVVGFQPPSPCSRRR